MAQDFAKRKQETGTRKAAPPRKTQSRHHPGETPTRGKGLRLYLGGVLTGVFLSFVGYLTTLPDPRAPADSGQEMTATPQPETDIPKVVYQFYNILPEQTLDVMEEQDMVEPAADVSKPPTATELPERWVLQAGSFRQREDAESRRAELIFLGLEPKIEEATSDTGRWFRVYLGPFSSQDSMTRARGLTANQNIDTLVLKRSGP